MIVWLIGKILSFLFPFRPAAFYGPALSERKKLGDWRLDLAKWEDRERYED